MRNGAMRNKNISATSNHFKSIAKANVQKTKTGRAIIHHHFSATCLSAIAVYAADDDLNGEVTITFPGLTKSSVVQMQTEDAAVFSVSVFKFVDNEP